MPEHESWCCLSPLSPCAQDGGCSGSCNCGADESLDACRPVTLPSGEPIRVRASGPMSPEAVAAVGQIVDAARAKFAAEHPSDPGADALWSRLDAVRAVRGLTLRQVGAECGVRFSTLFRIGQGRMPDAADLASIEAWLTAAEGA